ncbi:Lrp/AsnC family transcriptional regulator [Neomegalonema sp.]|uniref:Lrp/AsnC family transcriptional regulator n=1 Tax=Neomegalonema sp. TaxID=2039713 RepID=UPI0026205C67|nr:Lrp/AsnC family transcriptional regulator [Neomegalonema sp.]MDD2867957.1 Lrp/AsnC family transcriptional regulator [Neomegalonema sp.]
MTEEVEISARDRELLAILRENARTPIAEIARRLGVARTTAQTRLSRLEDTGVIQGYGVRLGEAAERGILRAVVLVAAEPRAYASVAAALKALPETEALYAASGRYDLLARVAAPGAAALDRLLDRLADVEGVQDTESVILLSTKLDRR